MCMVYDGILFLNSEYFGLETSNSTMCTKKEKNNDFF